MIISGDIEEVRFRNDENGYTIIVIDCNNEPIVVAGNFPPLCEGESVQLSGSFVIHPKFGKQFKAEKLTKTAPDSVVGIMKYLASGLIKGVGEKTALSIVNMFGKDSLNVIEFSPETLAKIRGISKNKAAEISRSFRDNKEMQESLMFLQNQNISLNLALKIYKQYGVKTIITVANNPYQLIEDVDGIGFATADRIASELGIAKESGFRIRAIILFVLKESSEKYGNTYLPVNELVEEVQKLGIESAESIKMYIDELVIDRKLKYLNIAGDESVMMQKLYLAERGAAAKIIKLIEASETNYHDCSYEIEEFERVNKLEFHNAQKEAIELAVNNGVSIITGGPGTGKTTILKCMLELCETLRLRPLLMAPTGRAAKRLSESTGVEASTIHRALLMNPQSENTSFQKLNADVVIIDEFSMVDIFLFNNVLKRLTLGTKLVIVGDRDQLPSVGAGNCLKDLMVSGFVPSINLTRIYRQSENSRITLNAHAINNGEMPELGTNSSSDFFFLKCFDQNQMAAKIIELYRERIPKYLKIDSSKIQILCPLKNGAVGANSLNRSIQAVLNPKELNVDIYKQKNSSLDKELIVGKEVFRVGDKVMHITNNYSLEWMRKADYSIEHGEGVFNGDIGIITDIFYDSGELEVELEDGRLVNYNIESREQLTLAYAITVHKSQGCEFDAIIMPVTAGSPVMMTRNLLYTAITRAKKMVVLVGEENSIRRMVNNNYIAKRYSALDYFLLETKNDINLLFDEAIQ